MAIQLQVTAKSNNLRNISDFGTLCAAAAHLTALNTITQLLPDTSNNDVFKQRSSQTDHRRRPGAVSARSSEQSWVKKNWYLKVATVVLNRLVHISLIAAFCLILWNCE